MADEANTSTVPAVSELAVYIRRTLQDVGGGWVEGEVQKLRRAGSGHVYFTLADEDATIECCIWRSWAERLPMLPGEGALVQARFAKVDFYGRTGRVSLHVDALRPTGDGELLARKHATLGRLQADGLVGRARRPLPAHPRRIGLIAARDSDAKTDVVKALQERWPAVHIVHRAALMEGVHCVASVIDALGQLQDVDGVDVIVVARGGGGVRDLIPFDDERLCRAVFACGVPVVTSIGHTAQRPNCDHVAAAFADVPARAAELVVPSARELLAELERHRAALGRVPQRVRSEREEVSTRLASAGVRIRRRLVDAGGAIVQLATHADGAFGRRRLERERELDRAAHELAAAATKRLREAERSLEHAAELIAAKDFRRSGWVLAGDADGRPVRSVADLAAGAELRLNFHDGVAAAEVTHTQPREGAGA